MINLTPKVTIVLPTFNEDHDRLRRSLKSIELQTFKDFECLIIDESTDLTSIKICNTICENDSRFKHIRPEKRIGLAASLNLGIQQAKGYYIVRFDSDDICYPDRIKLQINFIDQNPEVGVLGGATEIINVNEVSIGNKYFPLTHDEISKGMLWTSTIAHPTVMARKDLFDRFGYYDQKFKNAEDVDLWLRWLNKGVVFANLPNILIKYRQDERNRSKTHYKFYLRARIRNFTINRLIPRVLGILTLVLWMYFPSSIKNKLRNSIINHTKNKTKSKI